ncbi:MAG: hypothetical protein ABI540_02235 [Spartobacteria bacterium]
MIKRTLPAVAAILVLCVSLSAQEPANSNMFRSPGLTLVQASPSAMAEGRAALVRQGSFRSVRNEWYGGGPLTLVDGRNFSFPRTFGWVEATPRAFLPVFSAQEVPRVTGTPTLARSESNEKPQLFAKPDYVGGEVGVFFGKSLGGKYSRDIEAGYILGQIIEGNTQITVGASYGHESGKIPRIIGR